MSQLADQPKRQRKSHVSLNAVSLESESKKLGQPTVGQFPSKHTTYVYVNAAYDGLDSVRDVRSDVRTQLPPPTSVVREQYWACSKWPRAQRLLAITVGILVGAIVGLAVMVVIRGADDSGSLIDGLFRAKNVPG